MSKLLQVRVLLRGKDTIFWCCGEVGIMSACHAEVRGFESRQHRTMAQRIILQKRSIYINDTILVLGSVGMDVRLSLGRSGFDSRRDCLWNVWCNGCISHCHCEGRGSNPPRSASCIVYVIENRSGMD